MSIDAYGFARAAWLRLETRPGGTVGALYGLAGTICMGKDWSCESASCGRFKSGGFLGMIP